MKRIKCHSPRAATRPLLPLALMLSLLINSFAQADNPRFVQLQDANTKSRLSLQLKTTLFGHSDQIIAVDLSPDGQSLATTDKKRNTKLWDSATGKLIANLKGRIQLPFYHSYTEAVDVFSPDGRSLVTMRDKEALVWDASTGQLRFALSGHQKEVRTVAFSPDGKRLVTGAGDGTAKVWDATSGQIIVTLDAFRLKKYSILRPIARSFAGLLAYADVSFSADGCRVLTVPSGQPTKLWDAATGHLVANIGENRDAKFSPNGEFIETLSYGQDFTKTGRLWKADTGQLEVTLKAQSVPAFSPDGNWLALVAYTWRSGILNLKTMEIEIPFAVDASSYFSRILFSPDSRTLLIVNLGYRDHFATLIDASSGNPKAVFQIVAESGWDLISDFYKFVECLSFHHNSKAVMGANHNSVRFWDVTTGQVIAEETEARDPAVLSSDGKMLVTTAKDKKNILLWSVTSS